VLRGKPVHVEKDRYSVRSAFVANEVAQVNAIGRIEAIKVTQELKIDAQYFCARIKRPPGNAWLTTAGVHVAE
jgi:hypothetical protein